MSNKKTDMTPEEMEAKEKEEFETGPLRFVNQMKDHQTLTHKDPKFAVTNLTYSVWLALNLTSEG